MSMAIKGCNSVIESMVTNTLVLLVRITISNFEMVEKQLDIRCGE